MIDPNDRMSIAILGLLYSTKEGKMPEAELREKVVALDVNNMTEKQWRAFNRKCSRLGKWKRSALYELLN